MTQSIFLNCQPFTRILKSFQELKKLYGYDQASDLVLYNNKEIQVDQKTVYLSKWMEKGIVSIKDLLKEDGSYLSFQEFKGKFLCNANFIQYFQIISAIPDRLRLKARQIESVNNQLFTSNDHLFHFNRNFTFNLDKAKSRDFYNLFIDKTHNGGQTGPKRWSEIDHTLFTALLRNHSYKKSFGGFIQRTIHRSLQLWMNFYSELLPT